MGRLQNHLFLKPGEKVTTEVSLHAIAYNMKRLIKMIGTERLSEEINHASKTDLTNIHMNLSCHTASTESFPSAAARVILTNCEIAPDYYPLIVRI